jgi:RNA polymerase sigma factor (TIGR02999 family)
MWVDTLAPSGFFMCDVTRILSQIESGDPDAADRLLPLVYEELRKLARSRMSRESPDHTLQATALVHEAYLRLVGEGQTWKSRGHFFGAASEAMRRILVESARRKNTAKRGGDRQRDGADLAELAVPRDPDELLAVHDALDDFEKTDPEAAKLVKLRYFAGLTVDEAAECMEVSPRKAKYLWIYARSWLRDRLSTD